ncbi:bifunctional metallophosphatase/5'-nucleotidase [Chthonobacter rhizosphaerae]|uniref:bifunctional metallophosphatase/5'-nucleotidase n=1 Tax=Chthonobacter rhizosphaerae TaxID=2735553 RepID=UPI001FE54774|nr:bifunctional UDP-sugar hydrolase/5'-nucleotidase [Chthonobacter rhizosphaerae]
MRTMMTLPRMMTKGRTAAAAIAVLVALTGHPALAETVTLRFVQTNDLDRMGEKDGRGGLARVAAAVKAERAKPGTTFFVHAGDAISPSLLAGIDKGAHMITLLNAMGVDVMTPGNHEFDFGDAVFAERIGEARFPIVTSNVRGPDGAQPANTVDEKIVEVGGVKVGFYGLTTETTVEVASPGAYTFAPSVETAEAKLKSLRDQGADFVVAIAHEGVDVDRDLVAGTLADLVLSGHDHDLTISYNGKTALTESSSQGDYVVVTTVTLDRTEKDGKTTVTWRPDFDVLDSAALTPDPEIGALVKGFEDRLDAELNVEIGKTDTPLDSRRATVRGTEAAIGNLIADAIRQAVDADVGIVNGGGIRADREYAAGTVLTRRDILAELPFGNRTLKLAVTGQQLWDALENGLSQVEKGAGRFAQVSGLVLEADLKEPVGSRLKTVTIGGETLDLARTYTLAINDYAAAGGDGYGMLRSAERLIPEAASVLMASQVIDHIAKAGTVAPKTEGRIVFR